jgi:hypothetical protein
MEDDGAFYCENLEFEDKSMFGQEKIEKSPEKIETDNEPEKDEEPIKKKKYIRKAYKRIKK